MNENKNVHILHAGLPLCRFTDKVPGEWPEGHLWVVAPETEGVEFDITNVNCEKCRGVLLGGEAAEGSVDTRLFHEDGSIDGSELAAIIMGDTFAGEPIDSDWYGRLPRANQQAVAHAVSNAMLAGMLMGSRGMSPDADSIRALGERSPTTIQAVARMIQQIKDNTH